MEKTVFHNQLYTRIALRALKVSYSDVSEGGVAVNCEKAQFFLNTLYILLRCDAIKYNLLYQAWFNKLPSCNVYDAIKYVVNLYLNCHLLRNKVYFVVQV